MTTVKNYNCQLNVLTSVLWQYEQSENLRGLVQAKQNWYQENHCDFWNNWVRDVFDLNTANDFGLSVWAQILNLPLYGTNQPSPNDYPAWGFDSDSNRNFDNGNYATDSNQAFGLTTEQRRILLKLRFFQLTTECNVTETNPFLVELFGERLIYALDGGDMTITYVNIEALAPELRRAIVELDLLPRPAGVKILYVDASFDSWGFSPSSQNFDNGNYIGG